MKPKKGLCYLLAFLVVVNLFFPIVNSDEGETSSLVGPESRVTEDPKWQTNAEIWNDTVVWEDYRDDPIGAWSKPGNRDSNIYMRDLAKNSTTQITINSSSQVNPDIWENYVVWEDHRDGNADIYMVDLDKDELEPKRITDSDENQVNPSIHDGKIVWEDYRNNIYGDIYLYDISEEESYRLSDQRLPQVDPDIHGERVVWSDYRKYWWGEYDSFVADIYMFDLEKDNNSNGLPDYKDPETEMESAISPFTSSEIHQHTPSIYEEKVTWMEYQGKNNNDIYLKEVGGSKERVSEDINLDHNSDHNPDIFKDRIVYERRGYSSDGRHLSDSVVLYDVNEDRTEVIFRSNHTEEDPKSLVKVRKPAIHENRVVWERSNTSSLEHIDSEYDIFYSELESEETKNDNGSDENSSIIFLVLVAVVLGAVFIHFYNRRS
ncbi:MAG: hypothetical protein KGY76_08580 [Candidatus Thermoplasmatota archaeon]|nr:hypothetical protein [Candidatus Thermoplasmatota archaeon]